MSATEPESLPRQSHAPAAPEGDGAGAFAPAGSGLMFWILIGLAVAGFAPCVLLPVWRDYQAAALVVQREEAVVGQMQADVEKQRRAVEALRTDPAVAERLAQRELAYRRTGQRQVTVLGVPVSRVEPAPLPPPQPVPPPPTLAGLLARLPRADYDRIFCEPRTRLVVMLMCGGLAAAALILYGPQSHKPASGGLRADEGPETSGSDAGARVL